MLTELTEKMQREELILLCNGFLIIAENRLKDSEGQFQFPSQFLLTLCKTLVIVMYAGENNSVKRSLQI